MDPDVSYFEPAGPLEPIVSTPVSTFDPEGSPDFTGFPISAPTPIPPSPWNHETLIYFNARDESVAFFSATSEILWGVAGRFMPPVEIIEDIIPGQPGSRTRSVRHLPRDVAVPVWLRGPSAADLRATLREVVRILDPTIGDGRLQATAPDGSVRELTCRYANGLTLTETLEDGGGVTEQRSSLVFRCADPYWYERDATELSFTIGDPPTFFPFFPLRLASSTVFGSFVIGNAGDVPTWPVWTVLGPGEDLQLNNLTTGESLSLTGVIPAGATVVIDTRPGKKTIRQGTTNLYPNLEAGSALWALAAGQNELQVELSGADADTRVSISFRRAFLTP